jgi:hypothetical protein
MRCSGERKGYGFLRRGGDGDEEELNAETQKAQRRGDKTQEHSPE